MSAEARELLRRGHLAELRLERLVSLSGEVGVKLAELGRLRHEALIRASRIVALHLDRLFERLRADQFLGCSRGLLEHRLRVVREFDRDRLQALRERAQRSHRRVHVVFAELLNVIDILDHYISPGSSSPPAGSTGIYCTAQKSQGSLFAMQYTSPIRNL